MYLRWGETLSERNSPQDLTSKDLRIIEESNQYFARKFDEKIDHSIVDYFANKVRFERIKCQVTTSLNFKTWRVTLKN